MNEMTLHWLKVLYETLLTADTVHRETHFRYGTGFRIKSGASSSFFPFFNIAGFEEDFKQRYPEFVVFRAKLVALDIEATYKLYKTKYFS